MEDYSWLNNNLAVVEGWNHFVPKREYWQRILPDFSEVSETESHPPFSLNSFEYVPHIPVSEFTPNNYSIMSPALEVSSNENSLGSYNQVRMSNTISLNNSSLANYNQVSMNNTVPLTNMSYSKALSKDNRDLVDLVNLRNHKERPLIPWSTTRRTASQIQLDELKSYFNMPIAKAAKEMKVGLTSLKNRCRVLGLVRWPQRKMRSMNSLISNVREYCEDNERTRNNLEMLEQERQQMVENSQMDLTDGARKLRQFFFKEKYKMTRTRAMQQSYLGQGTFII